MEELHAERPHEVYRPAMEVRLQGCFTQLEADLLLHVCVCFSCVDGQPAGCDRSQVTENTASGGTPGPTSELHSVVVGVQEVRLSDHCCYEMGRKLVQKAGMAFSPLCSAPNLPISLEICFFFLPMVFSSSSHS